LKDQGVDIPAKEATPEKSESKPEPKKRSKLAEALQISGDNNETNNRRI
jgi:hypothetical protein